MSNWNSNGFINTIVIISETECIYLYTIWMNQLSMLKKKNKSFLRSSTIQYSLNRFPIHYFWIKRISTRHLAFYYTSTVANYSSMSKQNKKNPGLDWSSNTNNNRIIHLPKHVCKTPKKEIMTYKTFFNRTRPCLWRLRYIYIFFKKIFKSN